MSKSQTTDLCRFRSGHHLAQRRWKNLMSRSKETTHRLCDNEEESFEHMSLHCSAFDVNRQRLDLGASLDKLIHFPAKAKALRRVILRR